MIFMARGDHGVAVVKVGLFIVVVAAHAVGVSKPIMRSEALKDPISGSVHTHRHQLGSNGASELVVQKGWAKALLPNGIDENRTREHEIDTAGLLESRNAIDTVATLLDVKADKDESKKAQSGWNDLRAWTLSASTTYPSLSPDNIKVAGGHMWHDNENGVEGYIVLTASAAVTLKGFRVKAPLAGPAFKNFRFEYDLLGSDPWKTALAGKGVNRCCDWQTFSFPAQHARYWRLYMVDNWGYGWLAIEEMQVDVVAPTPAPTVAPTVEPTFAPLVAEAKVQFDGGLARLDKDGDLKVTWEEAEAGGFTKEQFDGMDVNGDGVLTAEDYAEAAATNSTGGAGSAWDKFLANEAGAYRSAQVSAISVLVFVLFSLRM